MTKPGIELIKRTQAKADAFAQSSTADLAKLVGFGARALPGIHKEERTLMGTPDEITTPEKEITIVGHERTRVECT